jgi:hypothetical protein
MPGRLVNDPVQEPEDVYVRQRYIRREIVDWVMECDDIMMRYGAVRGAMVYEKRKTARNRAERLIRYLVELRIRERWQLVEHTEHRDHGYVWSVEYRGERDNHAREEEPDDDD